MSQTEFHIDVAELQAGITALRSKKVLILGDVMLDVYLQGRADRMSQEAPVPIVHIDKESSRLGGAANVAHNIRALGGLPTLVGLCGADSYGQNLIQLLQENYIAAHVLPSKQRSTVVKTRVMAQSQQMLRFDREDCLPLTSDECSHICHTLDALLPTHDVLVISDYAKGLITPALSAHIQKLIAENATEVFIDPKPQQAQCYVFNGLMTPNKKEAALLANMSLHTREDVLCAGRAILEKFSSSQLLMTLGGEGMALFLDDGSVWNIASSTRAVFDVTGAGDTVIAALALARAAQLDMRMACLLSNYAAGCVLEHVGVATVSPEELSFAVSRQDVAKCVRWQ